jgi:hypothetical protein
LGAASAIELSVKDARRAHNNIFIVLRIIDILRDGSGWRCCRYHNPSVTTSRWFL